MKLASLNQGRDGRLLVVSRDLTRCVMAETVAPTLQSALDDWASLAPALRHLAERLASGAIAGEPFDEAACAAPLPRAYQWADGSAYLNHVELVRKARGADLPASFLTDPLLYQGGSDVLLGPRDPIPLADEAWGCDFEGEIAVITTDVPQGTEPARALDHIALVLLANDVSLRQLIPGELAKGFGFFQSKPPTAFSPVAVTPDELGEAWRLGRLHLPLRVDLNGQPFGRAEAGEDATFSLADLVAHAARTRRLGAGTIIGSGTVSNRGPDGGPGLPVAEGGRGYSCIAEQRVVETIRRGAPKTPFLRAGGRVAIEMRDLAGRSIFGRIEQVVAPSTAPVEHTHPAPARSHVIHGLLAACLGEERAELILASLDIDPALSGSGLKASRAQVAMALNAILFASLLDRVPEAAAHVETQRRQGRKVCFDHGALRTIDGETGMLPRGPGAFARILEPLGYASAGVYPLPALNMTGHVFTHADHPETVPQFFVSELHVARLPAEARVAARRVFALSEDPLGETELAALAMLSTHGTCPVEQALTALPGLARAFDRHHPVPLLADYETLLNHTAEGAWIAIEGNAFNHATDRVADVEALVASLKAQGLALKREVEVSASGRVRQTALLAARVMRRFRREDGALVEREVPGSFYEFISRDRDPATGLLDLSFDSGNATGIFAVTGAI